MSARPVLVTLATAWGPRFGGINAFNTEMVKSLGILPERDYDLICVVPGAETQERIEECRVRFGVELVSIESAPDIVYRLGATTEPERFAWIGHDDKTGPLALELRRLAPGSRAVLVNHMAHGAYQSVKKGQSQSAAEKERAQRELFREADLCFAVGPMLRSHLQDLLGSPPKPPPVEMLVPGLADPTEYDVEIRDSPPQNYVAFVAGRLDAEDDRIKQGRLALRAFGNAVVRANEHSAIRRSPKLRMRGVRAAEEEPLRDLLTNEAKGAVNFDFQDYTEDRSAYFHDLASASVAMMPSWHEGFGLTAWEAIASAVPVVVSEQSGVYRLLDEECSGAGLDHSVAMVRIAGWVSSSEGEPNHTEDDVVHVADALLGFGNRATAVKQEALTLRRNLLALGFDWKGCAVTFVQAVGKHLGVVLTAERQAAHPQPATASAPIDPTVPEALRVPVPRPWSRELGLPTSMLLVARDEVVRFDPERQPILDRMVEWASAPSPLSARLLFAPGGMGKTRLALELARRLQRSGWSSLWLPATLPADWLSALEKRSERPTLVVIDYADARPAAVLDALGAALVSLRAGNTSPVRLLLLARSESWLGTLAQHPNCSQEIAAWLSTPIEPVELPPWNSDETTRRTSYNAALEDYAAAIGVASPPNPYVPPLADKVFERPLYLHLAALAALEGQRPESAEALLRNQLQREWRYWCSIHGDQLASYDDWADALVYVILRQGADVAELQQAFESLGLEAPNLANALQRSYPASEDRIAPLEPDLIAEALLRERLAGRRGAAVLDLALGADPEQPSSAIPILARLAAHPRVFEREHEPAGWAVRLIAGIAHHWPHQPNAWLSAAHRAEFGLGRLLNSAWEHLDESARASMAATLDLPEYSTNLLEITVAVRRQQATEAQGAESKAGALNNLAIALSNRGDAGSRAEALVCSRQATDLYRRLAEDDPAVLPDLAMALNNLANRLSDEGDAESRIAAVDAAGESMKIYRDLVERKGGIFLPDLAMALNTLANRLSAQGGAASSVAALTFAREAVMIYRKLAEREPATYLRDLATSLYNLSDRLNNQGDADSRNQAVACAREAVAIRRQLAEFQPASFLPDLAEALTNFGLHVSDLADPKSRLEGLEAAREAVRIYRDLADKQPTAYLFRLAWALNNEIKVSGMAIDAASRTELLGCAREAVQIFRTLVESHRASYLPHLASSLNNLSVQLARYPDATLQMEGLGYAREVVEIYRELVRGQPDAYSPELARSLHNFAIQLAQTGDTTSLGTALISAREAVQIYACIHASMPAAFKGRLASAVQNLRVRATENGRDPEEEVRAALEAATES